MLRRYRSLHCLGWIRRFQLETGNALSFSAHSFPEHRGLSRLPLHFLLSPSVTSALSLHLCASNGQRSQEPSLAPFFRDRVWLLLDFQRVPYCCFIRTVKVLSPSHKKNLHVFSTFAISTLATSISNFQHDRSRTGYSLCRKQHFNSLFNKGQKLLINQVIYQGPIGSLKLVVRPCIWEWTASSMADPWPQCRPGCLLWVSTLGYGPCICTSPIDWLLFPHEA
jgi:hypothetical protein